MKYLLLAVLLFAARVEASDRGVFIAALPHEKFPVDDAYEALTASPEPSFGVLYGTFGKDPANVHLLADMLTDAGSAPRVYLYLTCGPCRRPRRDGSFEHFLPRLDIHELNATLAGKKGRRARRRLQALFARRVQRVIQTWVAPRAALDWVIIPELEDNLTVAGRNALYRIVEQEAIKASIRVTVARNPYPRGGGLGPLEIHSYKPSQAASLRAGDIVSGDGVEGWPAKSFITGLRRRGISFLLWRPEWQGIDPNINLDPDRRSYRFLEIRRIKALLKGE